VADKIREVSDELVKDGKLNPEQAKDVVDDLMQKLKSEQGNFETTMQRQLRNMLQDMGVPRQLKWMSCGAGSIAWSASCEKWRQALALSRGLFREISYYPG
jgi:polyhydroxyalkanoate synthesis regulator phasin